MGKLKGGVSDLDSSSRMVRGLKMRRVVVTGMGMVTPLGDGPDKTWEGLTNSKSSAGEVSLFDASALPCRVACEVKRGDGSGSTFNPDSYMDARERRRVDEFILFGMAAAKQAIDQAGWSEPTDEERSRTGVMIGSGIGGLRWISEMSVVLHEKGHKRVSPHFIAGSIINLVSGNVSIKYGYLGPNHAAATACSTGVSLKYED